MKKKFATYALCGQLALTLPFNSSAYSGEQDKFVENYSKSKSVREVTETGSIAYELFSNNVHLLEISNQTGITINKLYEEYDGTSSAAIEYPGYNCNYAAPSKIILAVTGVSQGETIVIGISRTIDDPSLLMATNNKVRLGSDVHVVAMYERPISTDVLFPTSSELGVTGDMNSEPSPVIFPIQLEDVYAKAQNNERLYIQAVVMPNGSTNWDEYKVSELDVIDFNVNDCSVY